MSAAVNQAMTTYDTATKEFSSLLSTIGADHDHIAEGVRRADVTAAATRKTRRTTRKENIPMTTATQPKQMHSNAPTFESLLADATELGNQAGQGKDTQIKFDLKLVNAAYLGSIDLQAGKHGKDTDDASKLYEAYAVAQRHTNMFDAKADSARKGISNARKMIKLGSDPRFGQGQPLAIVNDFVNFWLKMRKDPAQAKRLNDVHNGLLRFATAQLKSDTLLSDAEMQQFAFKKDPNEVTVEDVLESIRKKALALQSGKVANCNGQLNTPETKKVIDACTKALKDIATARGGQGATA